MRSSSRIDKIKKRLTQHLKDIDLTYSQHLLKAVKFSILLCLASTICLIHAIIPFVFERSASTIVSKLYQEM